MSLGPTHTATRLRVTPLKLVGAALGSLLLAGLTTLIYPRLIEHGAASGLVTIDQGLGIAAAALTVLLPITAIIVRLAR